MICIKIKIMYSVKYHYPYKNEHEYVASDNFLAIRSHGLLHPDYILSDAGLSSNDDKISLHHYYPEAGVGVYRITTHEPELYREKLKTIIRKEAHPSLAYIGTVYQDKETGLYQLYTGNVFLQLETDSDPGMLSIICERYHLELKYQVDLKNIAPLCYFLQFLNEVDIGRNIFNICEEIAAMDQVKTCYPELVVKRKTLLSSEIIVSEKSDFDWPAKMIDLYDAWKVTRGAGANICIIDDGIDTRHPAFGKNRIIATYDTLKDYPGAEHQYDNEMHGTACASIAASEDGKAIGVAPEANLLAVRCKGLGSVHEALAIKWAADQGADIISCSWGPEDGSITNPDDDQRFFPIPDHTRLAIKYAATQGRNGKGCAVFFAAGNGAEPVKYDQYASDRNVMAIGAFNKEFRLTKYSDYGPPVFACFPSSEIQIHSNDKHQLIYGVTAADRRGIKGYSKTDLVYSFGGTSAAAPGMAGVAALVLSIAPHLDINSLRTLLKNACRKPEGHSTAYMANRYGNGLINAADAVSLAQKEILKHKNMNNSATSNRFALHMGVDYFDENAYPQPPRRLYGCENDMNYYAKLTSHWPDENREILPSRKATREAFMSWLQKTSKNAQPGDIVLITYSGHGSRIYDTSGDEKEIKPDDDMDETLVLHNGFWLDDESAFHFDGFRRGVNILQIADCCHSGTNSKNLTTESFRDPTISARYQDPAICQYALYKNKEYYESSQAYLQNTLRESRIEGVRSNVVNFAACLDNQLAAEINNKEGLLTKCIKQADPSSFDGNLSDFFHNVEEVMRSHTHPNKQRPKLFSYGNSPENLTNMTIDEIFGFSEAGHEMPETDSGFQSTAPGTPDPKPASEKNAPVIRSTHVLLVDTRKKTVRIKEGNEIVEKDLIDGELPIDGDGTRGPDTKPWDQAYELVLRDVNDDISYCEPDIESEINPSPIDASLRGKGNYLHTYPHPEEFNKDSLLWHLGSKHSQLKQAFEMVCPESSLDLPKKETSYPLIAHIDTGILYEHPSIPKHFQKGFSSGFAPYFDKDKRLKLDEQQGHGQGTVSILAGMGWDEMDLESGEPIPKYVGAFPYARVMSLRISDNVKILGAKKMAKAVRYAIDKKADVITMSMAGAPSKIMMDAINDAYEAGIVVVTAGGNKWQRGLKKILPDRLMYPAMFNRVIAAVGANYEDKPYQVDYNEIPSMRDSGSLYMESCYGPQSAMNTALAAYTPNVTWMGTSMGKMFSRTGGGTSSATPQIAAAAALYIHKYGDYFKDLKGDNRWKKAEIVRTALFNKARKDCGYMSYFGNGILRAADTLKVKPEDIEKDLQYQEKDSLGKSGIDELINMWFSSTRSLNGNNKLRKKKEAIADMLSMELAQLVYLEPELIPFQFEEDIDTEMAGIILNSKHASHFLKEMAATRAHKSSTKSLFPMASGLIYNTVFDEVKDGVGIRLLSNQNTKSVKEVDTSKAELSDPIIITREIELDSTGTRSTEDIDFFMGIPEEFDGAALFQITYEDGRQLARWNFLKDEELPSARSLKAITPTARPGERFILINNDESSSKGLFDGIRKVFMGAKKIVVSVVRTIKGKPTSGLEGLINGDILKTDLTDIKNWKEVKNGSQVNGNGDQRILLLLHGTWSSTPNTFEALLRNPQFNNFVIDRYGGQVYGFEMSTIDMTVKENSDKLKEGLKGFNLDYIDVVASSLGCLVARQTFKNNNMVLSAGIHRGSPLANDGNITSLLNRVTSLLSLAGVTAPFVKGVFALLNLAISSLLKADGLRDQAEDSDIVKILAKKKITQKQLLIGSNFEPDKFMKMIFDEVRDHQLFGSAKNDGFVPLHSSLNFDAEDQFDNLMKNRYKVPDNSINHFQYWTVGEVVDTAIRHLK